MVTYDEDKLLDDILDITDALSTTRWNDASKSPVLEHSSSLIPRTSVSETSIGARDDMIPKTNFQILTWLCHEAQRLNINFEKIDLKKYTNIEHDSFKKMTLEDFIKMTSNFSDGRQLHHSKEKLFRHVKKRGRPSNPNKPKTKKSYGKLWEFLRWLLHNSETCPSIIKWDDYNEGRFKFVDPAKVAAIWGERKSSSKKEMNFTKFSRALRHHYKPKFLLPVYGRRLVYQFGPNATGWKTDNPIL